jgi:Zn-finger nucleic acid-binding protein
MMEKENEMAMETTEYSSRGNCPLCAAFIFSGRKVEETEILACPECQTMLVVDRVNGKSLILSKAPEIEEDWEELEENSNHR